MRCIVARQIGMLVRIVGFEELGDLGMAHRAAGIIDQQVLLRDIGDVFGFLVLREQVIERLVLLGPDFLRDRLPPFLGVVERRINVENDTAERETGGALPPVRCRIVRFC
jgi:hypothetical protein